MAIEEEIGEPKLQRLLRLHSSSSKYWINLSSLFVFDHFYWFSELNTTFSIRNFVKEDHGLPLFGTQFNHFFKSGQPLTFASVGSNRVSIYHCLNNGALRLVQCYSDPDVSQSKYYRFEWMRNITKMILFILVDRKFLHLLLVGALWIPW